MKQETKNKLKVKWARFKEGVKEWAPAVILGGLAGSAICGYVGAIDNSIKIDKMNKRLDRHAEVIDHNADVLDNRSNYLKAHVDDLEKQAEELARQNNLLMEKALQNGR